MGGRKGKIGKKRGQEVEVNEPEKTCWVKPGKVPADSCKSGVHIPMQARQLSGEQAGSSAGNVGKKIN